MAIKVESFIALENSLALRLSSTLRAVTSERYPNIQKAIKDENWPVADRLAQGLDLSPVFDLNEPYIAYLSQMAVLFGASRVTDTVGTSAVGLGFEKPTVQLMIKSFRAAIIGWIQTSLINSALQLIAIAQSNVGPKAKPMGSYLGTILKDDTPSALLPFDSFMDKEGRAVFNMASSLHTSRLSSFGFTSEAGYLGITEYQINEQLDGRTCDVCELMHGKVFQVQDARNLLDVVIRTQDPDELKSLQPWPSQSKDNLAAMSEMSSDELVGNGWQTPPFHPRCRGLLARFGDVPDWASSSANSTPVPEPYEATAEDFNQLGIKLSPARITLWNLLMQASPAEVVARLSGTTVDQLLESILGAGDPQTELGLANLNVTQTGVNVELQTPIQGSSNPITQDYYFRRDQTLFIGSIDLEAEDAAFLKPVLKNLYGTAKVSAMVAMKVVTSDWIGGYTWAKLGFQLSERQWELVKGQIMSSPAKVALIADASELEQKALGFILASTDPQSIYALADLPTLGKALLFDTSWAGTLMFDDPESMARFLAYIGAE